MKSIITKTFRLHRIKNWMLSLVALLVIFMAISFTLLRVAIKSIPDYAAAIEQSVSQQLGAKVEVGFIDAEIYWLVPRLNLFDVNIYNKDGSKHFVHLDEIDLSLDWQETLKTLSPVMSEIVLVGLNVQLGINKNSQLLIQGHVIRENVFSSLTSKEITASSVGSEIDEYFKSTVNNLDFKILDSEIIVYDDRFQRNIKTLSDFNLTLLNSGDHHVFEVKTDLPDRYGKQLHFVAELQGDLFELSRLNGKLYMSVAGVDAAPWLDDYWDSMQLAANAKIDTEVWLEWQDQQLTEVFSRVDIADVAVHYLEDSVHTWSLDKLKGEAHWLNTDTGWQLDVRNLIINRNGIKWANPSAAMIRMTDSTNELDVSANYIRMENPIYLANLINNLFDMEVSELKTLENYNISGDLNFLDIKLPLDYPDKIKINTKFNNIGFSLPNTEPKKVSNLRGQVEYYDNKTWLSLNSEDVLIEFNELFRNSLEAKKLDGKLEISNEDGVIRIKTDYMKIDTDHISTASRVDFYIPKNGNIFLDLTTRFKQGDAAYLGLYLPAGVMGDDVVPWLDDGVIKGNVTEGGYQFYGNLQDAPFREMQGISLVDFYVDKVDVNYLKDWPIVKDISAHLRFENDTLLINATQGEILNSKIKNARVYIDNFKSPTLDVSGDMKVELKDLVTYVNESSLQKIVTPYINNLELVGQGDLSLQLFLPLYGNFKTEIGGVLDVYDAQLKFKQENYKLTDIKGRVRFANDMVESSVLVAKIDEKLMRIAVDTRLNGVSPAYHIDLQGSLLASSFLDPIFNVNNYVKGVTDWDIDIDILPATKKENTRVKINVESDLKGISSMFPGAMEKKRKDATPLSVEIDIKPGQYINYALSLRNDVRMTLRQNTDDWFLKANMPNLKGEMNIDNSSEVNPIINIDLDYFDVNNFFKLTEDSSDAKVNNSFPAIKPRDIPSIKLNVKELKWKKFEFINSYIETQRTKTGMSIEEFRLDASHFSVVGKGNWISGWNNMHRTDIDATLKVSDLGEAFKELGVSDTLEATRGEMNVRWDWADMPHQFSWDKLKGDGRMSFEKGAIKQLDAGAGRLLGLFNFKTILSLDFDSQMKKGYRFDKVKASFSFSNGNVYSDDFVVKSKVADLLMNGYIGIDNEIIKQKITVRPHLGATVILGTAVVAGPAAGGIVYLFQKIFNTESFTEYEYSITGTLNDPKVTLLSVPSFLRKNEDVQDEELNNDY